MRDFFIIAGYELKRQLSKRTVIITTLILMAAVFIIACVPMIQQQFFGGNQDAANSLGGQGVNSQSADPALSEYTGYVFKSEALKEEYRGMLGISDANLFGSRDALVTALQDKSIQTGFVIEDEAHYEVIYLDKGMGNDADSMLQSLMALHRRDKVLAEKGLTPADLADLGNLQPQVVQTIMGRSSENNVVVLTVLMLCVYLLVLLYGSSTATMIAREKDSKAMELLITSTRPTPLILGKVAASGISGVVQFGLIALAGLAGFLVSRAYYDPSLLMMLQGSLSPSYIATYIFFSFTGYLLYLLLYAALGSTVSRVEDVGSATALVQFIFIAGYIASTSVMYAPQNAVAVITSLIPFTAVMVMPIRAGMMTVPLVQLLASGALMLGTLALFAYLSIKIYRWGTLNYGNKVGLIKTVKQALRL